MSIPAGPPIHGEFSSADASGLNEANSRILLYGQLATTALTLNANDTVIVSHLAISSAGTNLTVSIYDGADATVDAGEVIWRGVVPTNTTIDAWLLVPHYCQKGTWPKVKASGAGQVYVTLHGSATRVGA